MEDIFGRYVELDDASHGAPITHAAQVNRLLDEHLSAAEQLWSSS